MTTDNNNLSQYAEYDYPIPDPLWDYAAPYHEIWQAKKKVDALIATMSQWEDGSPERDRLLREALEQVQIWLASAQSFVPPLKKKEEN